MPDILSLQGNSVHAVCIESIESTIQTLCRPTFENAESSSLYVQLPQQVQHSQLSQVDHLSSLVLGSLSDSLHGPQDCNCVVQHGKLCFVYLEISLDFSE